MKQIVFVLLTIFVSSLYADCTKVLIVKDLTFYEILDKFEQPLTKNDIEKRFELSSPLVVIETNDMLGDDISMALSFTYNDDDYYLLKTENNNFVGNRKKQSHKFYSCCKMINDTAFYNGIAVRQFSYKGRYYINRNGKYLWSNTQKKDWKKNKKKTVYNSQPMSATLLDEIKEQINFANDNYIKYFNIFNNLEGKNVKAPKWIIKDDLVSFSAKLRSSHNMLNCFDNSNKILCNNIESVLMDTDFMLEYSNLEIIIK